MKKSTNPNPSNNELLLSQEEYFKEHVFENVSLPKLVLLDREFYRCTFKNAVLNFSQLSLCRFEECTFIGCDLSLSKMKDCSFIDVEFKDCKLVGIDWSNVSQPFKVSFSKCKLNDAVFYKMDLRNRNFLSCEIQNTDFEEANLYKAEFINSDLAGTKFAGANLTSADFSGALNYYINPNSTIIKKAKFTLPEAINLLDYLDIIIK